MRRLHSAATGAKTMTTDRQLAGAYDPVHVSAIMTEARRMRNAMILGFLRRLFLRHGERRATPAAGGLAASGT